MPKPNLNIIQILILFVYIDRTHWYPSSQSSILDPHYQNRQHLHIIFIQLGSNPPTADNNKSQTITLHDTLKHFCQRARSRNDITGVIIFTLILCRYADTRAWKNHTLRHVAHRVHIQTKIRVVVAGEELALRVRCSYIACTFRLCCFVSLMRPRILV